MKQNITLSLEKAIIQDAKVLAAKKSVSVSALLSQELVRLVKQDREYRQARLNAIDDLEQGLRLGGSFLDRESLYDR
jgi:hypothetical protein